MQGLALDKPILAFLRALRLSTHELSGLASSTGIAVMGAGTGATFGTTNSAGATIAGEDKGIRAYGEHYGALFGNNKMLTETWAVLAKQDEEFSYGIQASGMTYGAQFDDRSSGSYTQVAFETSKVTGTGAVSFVQNHPFDKDRVIVYAAPEGDEVATYTRGSARMNGSELRVPLGRTFEWVTNPDLGLTAYLTPRGSWADLYVESVSPTELVVRSADGQSVEVDFDYIVYGLRIGFEEVTIVQQKANESLIPSMSSHRETLEKNPDLRQYVALDRFLNQRQKMGFNKKSDFSAANALRDAIGEYNPAIHDHVGAPSPAWVAQSAGDSSDQVTTAAPDAGARRAVRISIAKTPAGKTIDAGIEKPPAILAAAQPPQIATSLPVSVSVQPGDLLSLDSANPGSLRLSTTAADPAIAGVVLTTAGSDNNDKGQAIVAMGGIVPCKVDAGYGSIRVGDSLVASPTPGHAMLALENLPGTILGKAAEPLEAGKDTIRVLISLR